MCGRGVADVLPAFGACWGCGRAFLLLRAVRPLRARARAMGFGFKLVRGGWGVGWVGRPPSVGLLFGFVDGFAMGEGRDAAQQQWASFFFFG